MSYFNRIRRQAVTMVLKAEKAKSGAPVTAATANILKGDCMVATSSANKASGQAWQSNAPQQVQAPAPADDEMQAHQAAAAAHGAADAAHVAAGKNAQTKGSTTVAAAHFQQAKQHFQAKQHHESQARDAQDAKDQGYRQ